MSVSRDCVRHMLNANKTRQKLARKKRSAILNAFLRKSFDITTRYSTAPSLFSVLMDDEPLTFSTTSDWGNYANSNPIADLRRLRDWSKTARWGDEYPMGNESQEEANQRRDRREEWNRQEMMRIVARVGVTSSEVLALPIDYQIRPSPAPVDSQSDPE